MVQHFQVNPQYSKTYKTFERAEKAGYDALTKLHDSLKNEKLFVKFIIAAVETKDGIRFSPVFYGTQHTMIWFIELGYSVVG